MTILGFDQSTTISGWCVFEDNKYIASGVVDLSNMKKDPTKRLMTMAENICKSIDKVSPDAVVIEDIFDNNNIHTLVVLGRLQGMIMLHCSEKGIPISILPSSAWRKIVGIKKRKREEVKEEAVQLVKKLYGIQVSTDEAEAVCITQAACNND